MGVVGINAAIGFFTERHAEDTINALSKITPRHTRVLRQGHIEEILHRDVVVGDILLLTPGDFIAADARLLKDNRLTLDESALTGESMPVSKTTEFIAKPDTPLADRRNMVYMGTMVTGGNALAVVVATGRQTQLGQIQSMVGETQAPETPMQRQLDQMGFQLGILSGAICAGVFGVGLLRGLGWLQMLKGSISLAVAAVPEGLPTVATTTLALGIRDMRNKRVAIRHLDAVETLGAVQVLCLDKTGTLTINRMTVVAIYVAQKRLVVANKQFYADGQKIDGLSHDELLHLLQIVTLCSESDLNGKADEQTVTGTPTENALIEAALAAGVDVHAVRSNFPRRHIRHRAEDRPFMSTIHGTPEGQKLLAMKGSPAEVLAHCTTVLQDGELVPLDDDLRDALRQENTRMAGDALRVLGVAYTVVDGRDKIDPDRLIWLGLVGMTDPLRPGMTELMQVFHSAGIHTVMITGDQSATAYAVGKQLRLSGDQPLQLLDSAKLDKLDPELLKGLIPKVHVFARVSPAHKLEIVQAIQRAGNVVAMTGDGINDGPALKAADIGVAMGGADSDVARSVADVVLEDDNLQTMSVAVQQGRATYNDIRKALHYLLATNLSEIEIMLMSISLGLGQPLNPMQLLWINLISDIFPALALSMEPAEPDLMDRPPRESKEHIIRRQDLRKMARESAVITTGSLASYLYALNRYGRGPQANTLAFHSLTLAQLVHAISCRSDTHSIFSKGKLPRNPYLNWAIGGSLAVQLLAMLVPGVRGLLGITRMGGLDTLVAVAGAIGPMLINEASKHISKNGMPRRLPSSTAGLDNPEETTTIEETPT
jgi:Ca2+-transporting ATPase